MDYDLRVRYNKLYFKKLKLISLDEIKETENEMKFIIQDYNSSSNVDEKSIKYDVDFLPNFFPAYHIQKLLDSPNDLFQQHLIQYLTIEDIVQLDNAMMKQQYRKHYLDKIANTVIANNISMKKSLFYWLYQNQIYLKKIIIKNNCNTEQYNLNSIDEPHILKAIFHFCEDLDINEEEN